MWSEFSPCAGTKAVYLCSVQPLNFTLKRLHFSLFSPSSLTSFSPVLSVRSWGTSDQSRIRCDSGCLFLQKLGLCPGLSPPKLPGIHGIATMNVCKSLCQSILYLYFTGYVNILTACSARWEVWGSWNVIRFHPLGFMAIHSSIVKIFHSVPKCWTNRPPLPSPGPRR